MRTILHSVGYALLAVLLGVAFWFVRGGDVSWPLAVWFGLGVGYRHLASPPAPAPPRSPRVLNSPQIVASLTSASDGDFHGQRSNAVQQREAQTQEGQGREEEISARAGGVSRRRC